MPACAARARISPAVMKLSCPTNSPGAIRRTRARGAGPGRTARGRPASWPDRWRHRWILAQGAPGRSDRALASELMSTVDVLTTSEARCEPVRRARRSGCSPRCCCSPSWRRPPGLGAAGWVVGVACAVTMAAALARGLARRRGDRLGPASWVTLARATLAVGVAALVADSFAHDTPVALLVTLAAVALALDAGRRVAGAADRDGDRAGRALRRRGRRVPDPRAQHLRRPHVRRVGPRDRGGALPVRSSASGCCHGCARRCRRAAGAGSSRRRRGSC